MNNLRDYYERALQEFATSDDGEWSMNASAAQVMLVKTFYLPCYTVKYDKIQNWFSP